MATNKDKGKVLGLKTLKASLRHFLAHQLLKCVGAAASVVSDSVWPHRRQPTRLPRPWDSPGKNTGAGCHFFLKCMKVESESEVTQLCPTLSNPMDCSFPGSSVYGIFQARVLEWGGIAFSILSVLEAIKMNQLLSSNLGFPWKGHME